MFTVKRFMVLAVLLTTLLPGIAQPVMAESPNQQFLTITTASCGQYGGSVSGNAILNYPDASTLLLTLRINGDVITDGNSNNPVGNFAGPWGLAWYVGSPLAYPYHWEWEWLIYVNGELAWRNTAGFVCDGGTATNFVTNQDMSAAPATGPALPTNFVLHTIICDTALYNTPGGTAINGAQIHAGQTWYVNPTPVEDSNGQLWTAIFVSSFINPYIPTSCVQ
jgi:hypothetical protein